MKTSTTSPMFMDWLSQMMAFLEQIWDEAKKRRIKQRRFIFKMASLIKLPKNYSKKNRQPKLMTGLCSSNKVKVHNNKI